jgi:hypothetical protein
MKIPCCIFTFSGDALPLRECVNGAIAAGLAPYVFDDINSPLPRHVSTWITENGGFHILTTFNRNGNLNGTACAIGIVRSMVQSMILSRSKIALKIDSDTLILDAKPFTEMSTGICSTQHDRRDAFGCCYSLTMSDAIEVFMHLSDGEQSENSPEDLTIWGAIKELGLAHKMHDFNPSGGAFSAVPKSFFPSDCVKFSVCTFGNAPRTPHDVTASMQRLNKFLQNQTNYDRKIS